jgi:thioredoxin-like negative regulator of GroEL
MYGPAGTHVDPYQHCGLVELIDELDGIQPEEHRQARVQEVSQEMIKLDLSGDEASQLMRLLHMQVAEPADEETVDEWQAESEAALRATYGSQASAVLDRAQRWLAQRPKAREQLDWSGLGSHPTVVKMLVEKSEAASLRKRNTAPKNRWKR